MGITYTTNYAFNKVDKYDIDWDVPVNGNWDSADSLFNGSSSLKFWQLVVITVVMLNFNQHCSH
jgi:hypothetical protein